MYTPWGFDVFLKFSEEQDIPQRKRMDVYSKGF
jgi:hypothetical protein